MECCLLIAITIGMRPGEYLVLTWSDFGLARGAVRVAKILERHKTA